jgi:homoserine kinase
LQDAVFNVGRAAFLACALGQGSFDGLSFAMEDRLHQPYRKSLVPGMEEVFAAAKGAGALGVALSGAGPTVMALSLQKDARLGEAMAAAFAEQGVRSHVIWTKPSSQGALCQFEEKG